VTDLAFATLHQGATFVDGFINVDTH
jgi:hypothetical protein